MPQEKGYADYVLWDDDASPLAVIEVKKASVEPELGRQQAKLYADSLEQKYGQRPIVFTQTDMIFGSGMMPAAIHLVKFMGITPKTVFNI